MGWWKKIENKNNTSYIIISSCRTVQLRAPGMYYFVNCASISRLFASVILIAFSQLAGERIDCDLNYSYSGLCTFKFFRSGCFLCTTACQPQGSREACQNDNFNATINSSTTQSGRHTWWLCIVLIRENKNINVKGHAYSIIELAPWWCWTPMTYILLYIWSICMHVCFCVYGYTGCMHYVCSPCICTVCMYIVLRVLYVFVCVRVCTPKNM